jgi:hypothetical protein
MSARAATPKLSWNFGRRGEKISLSLGITVLYAIGFYFALSAFAALLRMRYGDGPLEWISQRILVPAATGLAIVYLLADRKYRVDLFSFTFIFLFVYASTLGFAHWGINDVFVSHAFQAAFGIVFYLFGRHFNWHDSAALRRGLTWIGDSQILINIPLIGVYLVWVFTGAAYFGMSAYILILSTIVCIHERRYRWAAVAGALILFTGKRGDMAGAVVALLAYLAMGARSGNFRKTVLPVIGFVVMATVVIATVEIAFNISIVDNVIGKFAAISKVDLSNGSSTDTRNAVGGRGMELLVVGGMLLDHGYSTLLWGLGYGWSVVAQFSELGEANIHFVHVSPINTVAQYGLIFAFIYWSGILITVAKGFRNAKGWPNHMILVPYACGMLVASLASYAIAVDPILWICLGAISVPTARNVRAATR